FVLGVDMIRRLVGKDAAADAARRIAFANLAVTDYVPVPGSDVTMYLSLCRFNDSSLVRGLLDLAAKTAAAVAGPAGGAMVKTATDFTGTLMNIFLADGVETRFGRLDGRALDRSGYRLLLASGDPALDPKDLHIQDGQLLRRSGGREAS